VGTLDPRKGFIRFVHAYALDPSFPILLQVGSSPSAEIKNTLFQLGLEKKVHFLGQQKIETLHSLYENCEALVFPSEYEGYGIPPVEARAAGARIITTPMPSVVEALGEVPRLSTNGDDHDWKSSIRVALNEPKPNRLNQSAQNQLSWSRVAIQTASIYNEIF
jgi:glycosyltransferase involved in cell wall biosynthesis